VGEDVVVVPGPDMVRRGREGDDGGLSVWMVRVPALLVDVLHACAQARARETRRGPATERYRGQRCISPRKSPSAAVKRRE
jgi:hypothetical protein